MRAALAFAVLLPLLARAGEPEADAALHRLQDATWALPQLMDAAEKGDAHARGRLADEGPALLSLYRDATRGADEFARAADPDVRARARARRGAADGAAEQLAERRRRAIRILKPSSAKGPPLSFFDPRFLPLPDPTAYERHAYAQKSTDACAVALQLIVLRAHGLLPGGDPAPQEAALMAESRRRGYTNDGTSPRYATSLLTDRGMTIIKRDSAHWRELKAALLGGAVAQVSVDGAVLHGLKRSKPSPHAVLLTGIERADDGSVSAVRLVDPRKGPAVVPVARFHRAWRGDYAAIR